MWRIRWRSGSLIPCRMTRGCRRLGGPVPPGTELDAWEGRTLVSIVAFEFADVRVMNVSVPFHRDFEEMNLRFYVRREVADGWRRGVVFVREVVPLPTVALLARVVYGEPYKALPMERGFEDHSISPGSSGATRGRSATTVRYSWRHEKSWHWVEATADTAQDPRVPEPGSVEEFLTDHAYGYGIRRGQTIEYVVEHPTWRYWNALRARLDCRAATLSRLWGDGFASYLESPCSAYLVEGSGVGVRRARVIRGCLPHAPDATGVQHAGVQEN